LSNTTADICQQRAAEKARAIRCDTRLRYIDQETSVRADTCLKARVGHVYTGPTPVGILPLDAVAAAAHVVRSTFTVGEEDRCRSSHQKTSAPLRWSGTARPGKQPSRKRCCIVQVR